MASLARTGTSGERADGRPRLVVHATKDGAARLESAHEAFSATRRSRVHRYLKAAHRVAHGAYEGAGATDAADRLATSLYVGMVVARSPRRASSTPPTSRSPSGRWPRHAGSRARRRASTST